MLLRESYDEVYNIQTHDENSNPLALVAFTPKENCTEYSALYNSIRRYRLLRINEKFGLSLTEYLDLPRDIVELLSKILEAEVKNAPRPDLGDLEKIK